MLIKSTRCHPVPQDDFLIQADVLGDRELQLDDAAFHPGRNRTGDGFEGHFRAGQPYPLGKTGRASAPVAAHLGLAAVGVKKPPFKIVPFRRLDKYHPVGPDR